MCVLGGGASVVVVVGGGGGGGVVVCECVWGWAWMQARYCCAGLKAGQKRHTALHKVNSLIA